MQTILFVFATSWDGKQLAACRPAWRDRYTIEFVAPSELDFPDDFVSADWLDETSAEWRGRAVGVTSSSDYPGATLAAALAERLGLPGGTPKAVIGCSHKYYSRRTQQAAVPEATPWFALVDPKRPLADVAALHFPCHVKPVKGAFSVFSSRIDSPEALAAYLDRRPVHEFVDSYLELFHTLVREHTDFEIDGRWFIAEELLAGELVTVEGYIADGRVGILGVVDSVTHAETHSFLRFDYPSALAADVQARMHEIAIRLISASGLQDSMFNIEMIHEPASGRIRIIEVNPRLCGQFGDLYAKVDGISGYEIALSVAAGQPPARTGARTGARRGRYGAASSFPLRVFEPVRVVQAPDAATIARVEASYPGTLVWSECTRGQTLADFEGVEDGSSCRYGIVNLGGRDRADVLARFEAIRAALGYAFEPRTVAD